MKYIKWFKELSKKDIPLAGGKGANLAEMTKMGLPIPPGFIVTSKGYEHFLDFANLKSKIKQTLKDIKADETRKIAQASKKIKDEILAHRLPEDLVKEIETAYEQLTASRLQTTAISSSQKAVSEPYVAIRSSATAEDLPSASFAGQQATFLNVKGRKNVSKSVLRCFASLFETRAIFYRIQNKFDHLEVKIAVPIQTMVQSEKSGVLFTVDPLTSDKEKIAIEAGLGLGEAIVSGSIIPDRYLVDKKNLRIVAREIHEQKWMIKKTTTSNKHVAVPKELQEEQKLSDEDIKELAQYGLTLEKHYRAPQDVEWAIVDGKIYLLQTRPVTTIGKRKEYKEQGEEIKGEVLLKGLGASIGEASGTVVIIHSPREIDKIKEGNVLVAEMTNPCFVPAMKKVEAVVTDTGGVTSHAAIVSRELGIPCVVGTGKATSILKNGQMITVDGSQGLIYKGSVKLPIAKTRPAKESKKEEEIESVPTTATKIYVNLGEPSIASEVAKEPCDGVGLLRAEFIIAEIGEHPRSMAKEGRGKEFAKKLSEGIKTIAEAFHPRPVVFRATDFKTNEYKDLKGGEKIEPKEQNPMLGYRGAFRYVSEPDLFKLELRALTRVREQFGFNNVWLMIPFVRTIDELEKVEAILEEEGIARTHDFKLWMMVEVPSNVFLIDKFCQAGIDGVSIGSNDLTQLILGVDRDNEKLAQEFNERNEAVILAIKHVIETCRKYDVTSSLCGQAPSFYPEFTEMLVEAGITSISVNPDGILETKKLVASIEQRILLDKIKEIEGLQEEVIS